MPSPSYLQSQIGLKFCGLCNTEKPVSDFDKRRNKVKGWYYYSYCRQCEKKRKRASDLKRKYNLKEEEYRILEAHTNKKCWICGEDSKEEKAFSVDHCHRGNQIRGLLCTRCNALLGFVNDDVLELKRLTRKVEEYLADNGLKVKELLDESQRSFCSRVA